MGNVMYTSDLKFHFAQSEALGTLIISLYLENRCVKITINDLLGLQQSPESMGRNSRIALDPNKEEAFGNNATFRLTSALEPLLMLSRVPAWLGRGVVHKTVGRGHRQVGRRRAYCCTPAALHV